MPKGRKSVRRRVKRRTNTPRRGTAKRNPYGGLILTGVRSLISALPGSAILTPLVDLFFSSIGITEQDFGPSGTGYQTDGIAIHGVTGAVFIKYVNIVARSPNASLDLTKGPRAYINAPYSDGRLISLSITALPSNVRESRSGKWSMLFIPFRSEGDFDELSKDYKPIPQARLQTMAGSITDAADRPLKLDFRPKVSDGLVSRFNPINNFFGMIVISYSQPVRDEYHDLKAEDFATSLTFRGTVEVRQPYFTDGVKGFEDKTWSPEAAATIYSTKSKKSMTFANKSFKCDKSTTRTGLCVMNGEKYVAAPPKTVCGPSGLQSLEDMELN